MPCCGQNREKARVEARQPAAAPVNPAPLARSAASPGAGSTIRLRYRGSTSITVRGPRSGRSYTFSGREPERFVDGRDVEALLKIGLFQRAG
jgi:hypothetical protein